MKLEVTQIILDEELNLMGSDLIVVQKNGPTLTCYENMGKLIGSFNLHPIAFKINEGSFSFLGNLPKASKNNIFTFIIQIFEFKDEFNDVIQWLDLLERPDLIRLSIEIIKDDQGENCLRSLSFNSINIFELDRNTNFVEKMDANKFSVKNTAAWQRLIAIINLLLKHSLYFDNPETSLKELKKRVKNDNILSKLKNTEQLRKFLLEISALGQQAFGKEIKLLLNEKDSTVIMLKIGEDPREGLLDSNSQEAFWILFMIHLYLRSRTSTPVPIVFMKDVEAFIPVNIFAQVYSIFKPFLGQFLGTSKTVAILKSIRDKGGVIVK